MKTDKKVTCVMPAYNEEKRISKVLRVVISHPMVNEIIVINDCSKDRTLEVIKKFKGIKIINNKKNKGKTFSVMEGIIKSKNDLVLLLDADLVGLTKKNITDLILPVLENKADVTISLRKNPFTFRIIGADSAAGERVFNRKIIPISKLAHMAGYGLESFINDEIFKHNYRIRIVDWGNVYCTAKTEKLGRVLAMWDYLSMWYQMIKTTGLINYFAHPFMLARLNRKNKQF